MDIPQQSLHRLDSGFSTSLASINCTCHRNRNAVKALRHCCFVNRAFYRVASSLLWQQPQFVTLHSFETFASLCGKQAPAAHELRRLILSTTSSSNCPLLGDFVTPLHIALIAEAAPRDLVHIDLTGCHHVTDAALAQLLVVSAPSLQILILTGCRLLTDAGGMLIAGFCSEWESLKVLRLRSCGLISDATLIELGKTCASFIECLDLSNCPRITDRGIFRFLDKTIKMRRGKYEDIIVTKPSDNDAIMDTEDAGLIIQGKIDSNTGTGRLSEFRFSGSQSTSRKLTWFDLERILECVMKGNRIQCLEFSIPPPTKNAPKKLYKTLPIQLFTKITSLHIHNAENMHSEAVDKIATYIGNSLEALTLTKVKYLDLSHSKIDTALLHHLIHGCDCAQTIETLNIGHTRTLTDLSLFPLCLLPPNQTLLLSTTEISLPLPNLKSLSLAQCPNITFDGILPLIQTYANPLGKLEFLDITGTSIDTKSWPKFMDQCEELERAFLSIEEGRVEERRFERVLPEFVGVDSGSSEREYVFSGDGGWVMRRDEAEENRDEDVETDVESDEESWEEDGKVSKGLNSGKVFLLKDARYAEVLRRKRLVCIAKYGKTVLGDEL